MIQDRNHTFIKALRAVLVATMLLLLGNNAMAQVTVKGSVFGGGNDADVQTNTVVNISAGQVEGNVYGGGNLGDVGTIVKNITDYNYKWTNETNPGDNYIYNNTGVCNVTISGGTVGADGTTSSDKDHGNVFGGGKGDENSLFYCEKGMVYSTNVVISAGTVKGTVFGGGEVGRVENNTIVTIGVAGANGNTSTPIINGDVFGAGKGLKTHGYSALVRGNPVVTIQGKTQVGSSVYGGGEIASVGKHKVKTPANADDPETPSDLPMGMPFTLANTNLGKCTVTIKDNVTITGNVFGAGQGVADYTYNSSNKPKRMGMSGWEDLDSSADYLVFLQTLALSTDTHVTIEGNANINGSVFGGSESGFVQYDTNVTIKGGVIGTQGNNTTGDVYGGGRGLTNNIIAGRVNGNTNVHILGGTITNNVYGGAALAKSNAESTSTTSGTTTTVTYPTATVNLLGGIIGGDAYGGGLGDANTAADVGNTKVNLNGLEASDYIATIHSDYVQAVPATGTADHYVLKTTTSGTGDNVVTSYTKGATMDHIFGANNTNGSPKGSVTVHVFSTQHKDLGTIQAKYNPPYYDPKQADDEGYKAYLQRLINVAKPSGTVLTGVAESVVTTAETTLSGLESTTEANLSNDQKTSITTAANNINQAINGLYDVLAVYGGGNNANYTPDANISDANKTTNVIIEGCDFSSIQNVYGGGNAAAAPATDVLILGTKVIDQVFGGGNGEAGPQAAAHVGYYRTSSGKTEYATGTGTGATYVKLVAGNIYNVYGGSNSNGDIRGGANTIMPSKDAYTATYDCCDDLITQNVYGGGKNADMSSGTNIVMGCMPNSWIEDIYAGSREADVSGDVSLTITSGKFERVFGGNKTSGKLKGSITVNIEETGDCGTPIIIGELYAGGNLAHYSIYGYKTDGTPMTANDLRTELTTNNPGKTAAEIEELFQDAKKDEPQLNVRAFTSIGAIYGGGYSAKMYADPTVSINVVKGKHNTTVIGENLRTPNTAPFHNLPYPAHASGAIGTIGNVFGGGNLAEVNGSTTVNIGTESTVTFITEPKHLGNKGTGEQTLETSGVAYIQRTDGLYEAKVEGANITGNVYGGGNLADVTGNTQVNICAKKSGNDYIAVAEGASKVTIGGNVFGGGQGVADNFYCDKAMVGKDKAGETAGYLDGNTSVIIGNGTVNGSVYGGGEVGRVEMNTTVTIGLPGGGTSAPDIKGDVFGGGKGEKEHGYAALVRGNPTVTIQANAKVEHNVYGGGEIASVARYKVPLNDTELAAAHSAGYTDAVIGRPYALKDNNSGFCTVTVKGNAVIGPDTPMKMYHKDNNNDIPANDAPDDAGHVFGAGKGIMPENYDYDTDEVGHKPRCRANNDSWTWFDDVDEYIAFIQTLALSSQTTVTIGDDTDSNCKPFIKGSVYGGSENGLVQFNTNVYIKSGQIGCGKNTTKPHVEDYPTVWDDNFELPTNVDLECSSWDYGWDTNNDGKKDLFAPYDPFANATGDLDKYPPITGQTVGKLTEGGRKVASDGHTFYGNVFGGGSGSVPYFDTKEGISKYLNSAGTVKGNTTVTISGGHILTNVYGGCEATNVLGKATVNMTNGTIGVPRTAQQIKDHPVTCYLFGAGKGDQRIFFNKDTNVEDVEVEVSGGRIYGSVFGGGEDGHVMRNVKVTIGQNGGAGPKIGTVGSTYVDGNVFGGGRGFGGEALTAGNVGGAVDLIINGGEMLGSIYGGGRLASVGYGLYLSTGDEAAKYGKMRADDEYDDPSKPISTTETAAEFFTKGRGHITVTVNGGTIGKKFDSDVEGEHSGNVFGGSMGRLTKLDGSPFDDSDHWALLATAKSTTVNINGGEIKRSVYGGGEMGTVTTNAIVNVSGGTIGTTGKGGAEFGNVYGGGKGYVDPAGSNYVTAGIIKGNTTVAVSGSPQILHNVYGGGAYGSVGEFDYDTTTGMPTARKENTTGGIATVTITGGTIGTNGDENGMIFGSSRGDVGAPGEIHDKLAWAYDANVVIGTSGSNDGPQINGSVYGSGENGHTFNDATVNIHGGTIGIVSGSTITTNDNGTPNDTSDDTTYSGAEYPYRGNVYGGGCGTDKYDSNNDGTKDSYNALAGVVYGDTQVTIDGGQIVRNVYGAGAMGSVGLTNATGAIIKDGTTTITISGGKIGVDGTKGDGNVFGAARGDFASTQPHLAQVRSTSVSMSDGTVYGNVYGGGEAGDVGTYVKSADGKTYTWDKISDQEIGSCAVVITGGSVNGHVFGAGKGEANTFTCEKAMVRTATVNISAGTVGKNVYGGGEVGRVDQNSKVTLGVADQAKGSAAPIIAGDVFGAGAGKETHGYSALVRGNAEVIVQGNAKVGKSVYGGGEIAAVGRYGLDSSGMPSTLVSGGECKVTVKGYADIEENVFGAGEGVDESKKTYTYTTGNTSTMPKRMMTYDPSVYKEGYENPYEIIGTTGYVWEYYPERSKYLKFLQTLALVTDTKLSIEGNATVKGSVYGGSESGFVQRDTELKILGAIGTDGSIIDGNVYGGGKGLATFAEAGRVNGGVTIDVSGSTTRGSVYGGGEMGVVKENVTVDILGGTIDKDVYGGGALAHTQTGNWDTTNNTWLADKINTDGSTAYKTIVNLTGGTIKGDAYGGGLGDLAARGTGHSDVAALVYGDVFVTLDGTAFDINKYEGKDIVKSGRVFGCNNLNGSPKGDVTVTVNKTVTTASGVKRTPEDPNNTGRPPMGEGVNVARSYELAAVYGGGNLANYEAEGTGRKTHVIINSCDVSINQVYGGGNAAKVPETDVLVNGAYEIHQVFGGGNGADMYTLDNGASWKVNPGADIDGNANTLMKGGYIHEAYGGSNEKGTITGNITIDTGTGGLAACPVQVDKLVGAGKNADVNGNLIIILGCKDATKIPIVYGGADNAHVNGNVELTITSGRFGQVFGGNNLGGVIKGHIYLNIEETSDCEPIRIDDLYLGGNQAAYSRFGYYVETNDTKDGGSGVGANTETPVLSDDGKLILKPRVSATDTHLPVDTYALDANDKWTWTTTAIDAFKPYEQPVLNVTSCTSIGRVFGGGLGEGAAMYADPTVNINMIPGKHAQTQLGGEHKLGQIGIGYTDTNNQPVEGGVFGGGNEATVYGNTTVNIGTEKTVKLHLSVVDANTGEYTMSEAKNVEGANILSNVYGGGNEADVTGNTYVNVCAKEADDASTADVIEYKGVTISGTDYEGVTIIGNVFGGGKGIADSFTCAKAMIGVDKENDGKTDITKESTNKGTRVSIGNGTVNGTVYGGGEIGRVEWNTVVSIGLPVGEGETSAPVIRGNVFGAGKGVEPYGYAALVRGNTFVTVQADAKVGESIFGGGEIASVGKYTIASAEYAASHPEIEEGMPYSLANQGSGYCNVIVRGNAEIGPDGMVMNNTTTGKPDDTGHVFGAGKGVLPYENLATIECQTHPGQHHPGRMAPGNVWECYDGNEAKYLSFVETQALATQTEVTISGNAFVKGSVYGGSENGHVQHDTHVTIEGDCQIGAGFDTTTEKSLAKYTDWPTETESIETSWKECAHWEYAPNDAAPWDPYAIYESDGKYYYDAAYTQYAEGGAKVGKDGHTFYGNVFGGGSGLLPYAPGKWHRASGSVGGNTQVDITGGHILTSVYGGNEQTDVGTYKKDSKGALVVPVSGGKCTINMTGGTLGVPRTADDAKAHPVTCYLFGAGKGDQRIFFNTWTNVINTEVNISGTARIYGSTFGGGEDGHVIKDAVTNMNGSGVLIGTTGTSYVDGNIFGGGRGFSGDAQTAGTVGGNIEVNITEGKILGSVYGGGRLASVGTMFTDPKSEFYGQFKEDDADGTYGHVKINISGGTIGNDIETIAIQHTKGGNVFGGSMGRLERLDGSINPLWPKLAQVKTSTINITGGTIKNNVYGGGEMGTVREDAKVTITDGIIGRDVYGGGYGSDDYKTKTSISVAGYEQADYTFTPMQWAGCVGGDTYVNISGGQVRKSVYGGGEMASVGIINYTHVVKNEDASNGFVLSWPYQFEYIPYLDGGPLGGATHVNITGGRIGAKTGDPDIHTDNGDVYGAGKGIAGDYNDYVFCANVRSAEVTIDINSDGVTPKNYEADGNCVAGAVYGGGENGHVMEDTKLTITNGLIGHSVYGGGSGKGTFSKKLLKIGKTAGSTNEDDYYTRDIYSITAGKVFGNTEVNMTGGHVVRNVYGGGNMGSVGKGNYAGGADDYSTAGYGEKLSGNLWDGVSDFSKAFLNSGKCVVRITGGTIGYIDESDPSNSMYPWNSTASLPYGNVFGGCRGESAPNIVESPRYLYSPEFFVGYVNETQVTIEGDTKILGSVYGGGMDGHVRRDASVTIKGGEIGLPFTEANQTKVKTSDPNDIQWLARGNVYGSGSGIGKYKYDFDYDGKYTSTVDYNNGRSVVSTKEEDYSTSAGSVTRFTMVDIQGGTIHRNVYGGGSLSSVGAPKIGQSYDPYHPDDSEHSSEVGKQSLNKVTISGGQIGDDDCLTSGYGGGVNGGSRGAMAFENSLANPTSFANGVYTDVTISGNADVKGNVFGGGEAGIVKHDTEVKMTGGAIGNDIFGGGDLADVNGNTTVLLSGGTIKHDVYGGARGTATIAANVGGDVLVDLNGGVDPTTKGAVVKRNIFGANNVNGTPKGHVLVYVHGTQNENTANINTKVDDKYDVIGVFGGGNQSDYVPTDTKQSTEVIIEGCDLTSIDEVYGGGYGAATPATSVLVKGTKIINNVYGGGYGASTDTYTNPGANVGYLSDKTLYGQGTGKAIVQLMAGTINNVYGGSNTKGDIRGGSSVTNVANDGSAGCCDKLSVGEIYGGGKKADMFGGAEIVLGCMPDDWIGAIYAGAENADVGGDVGLTLTSGKFERVFGGNKSGGKINGYIEVNIEENPECGTPIIIGELYGGGNEAPYTIPAEYGADYLSPRVNVRAFTSIGTIFGGGLGATATVTGNPWVNINEVAGGREYAGETRTLEDGTKVTLYERKADGKMGVIGTVFGGGNAAPVIGNPRVEIGTAAKQKMLSLQTKDADGITIHEVEKDVLGADIRGNVYGGGNNAEVTGDPKVTIGQKKTE